MNNKKSSTISKQLALQKIANLEKIQYSYIKGSVMEIQEICFEKIIDFNMEEKIE